MIATEKQKKINYFYKKKFIKKIKKILNIWF